MSEFCFMFHALPPLDCLFVSLLVLSVSWSNATDIAMILDFSGTVKSSVWRSTSSTDSSAFVDAARFVILLRKFPYNQNFAFADYCCATQTRSQLCNFQFLSCDMRCIFIVQLLASNYSLSFNPFPGVCDVNPINWIFEREKNCFFLFSKYEMRIAQFFSLNHYKWGKLKRNKKITQKLLRWTENHTTSKGERNKCKTEALRYCCVFSITSKYFKFQQILLLVGY